MSIRNDDMYDECAAFIVVKAPVPGGVKTRLASSIGDEAACEVYRIIARGMVDSLKRSGIPLMLAFYPRGSEEMIEDAFGCDIPRFPQRGSNLGERLCNAFSDLFESGMDRVVAISSDVPELSPGIVSEALDALRSYDAVIGPCPDGGFYLIGFKKEAFYPEALRGQSWGSSSVLDETMKRMSGLHVHVLPPVYDIDTLEDLRAFVERGGHDLVRELRRFVPGGAGGRQ
ncbi:MAG: TIGR04282 family arsenosugar biosynthesis glycosyltransferase [Candidatus Thermoplasmatota archaeon]|nr:TIGR04282 family arsenosugar biosynthesis glycosyltransferase [Candidatus Thermoplasmatota archaeon]